MAFIFGLHFVFQNFSSSENVTRRKWLLIVAGRYVKHKFIILIKIIRNFQKKKELLTNTGKKKKTKAVL